MNEIKLFSYLYFAKSEIFQWYNLEKFYICINFEIEVL